MAQNPKLQLFDYNPAKDEFVDFRCGNSKFSDEIWDFTGYVDLAGNSEGFAKIKFGFASHKPRMQEVIKWFAHHEMITGKIATAKRSIDGMSRFVKYVDEFIPEMESFSDINQQTVKNYFHYLIYEAKTLPRPGKTLKPEYIKKLTPVGIRKHALAFRNVLRLGSVKGWDVPSNITYLEKLYNDYIIKNKALKPIPADKLDAKFVEKIGDERIIDRILECAVSDLDKKENVIVSAGTIIMTQLGLRINELVTIESAAIVPIGGEMKFRYVTRKLHKEPTSVTVPANELVILAVETLLEHTKELRANYEGEPLLFLQKVQNIKGTPPGPVSKSNFGKNFIRPWLAHHRIKYDNGEIITDYTAHTFRHIFATYALKGGASIESISKLMNHRSIRGTRRYTTPLPEEVKKKFAQVFNENAVISGKQALSIKERLATNNPFKGKTVEQVDKIRRAMKIQILSHGMCLHHPMRNEPCAGDGVCMGCRNFVTTPDFLEVHKGRLQKVRGELSNPVAAGPYETKLKTIETYLVGVINDLETQMAYKGKESNMDYSQESLGG